MTSGTKARSISHRGKPGGHRRHGTRALTRIFLGLFLLGASLFGLALAASRPRHVPESAIAARPIQVADQGYAGSQTCRACHPREHATWQASYHRTMTQVATPDSVRADFDGVTVDAVHGRPMRLERDGARFFAEFDDPDGNSDAGNAPRIRREVVMITGSHHQQIYWYATGKNRLLGQLPGAYLIGDARWIPRRMAVLSPPTDLVFSETGHWNSTCIACHATSGKPQFDTPFESRPIDQQTVETTAAEFGIACEACHGPGGRHASANRSPLRRYGLHLASSRDESIVQPQRLAAARASQVCGQCHGVWEFNDEAGERLANAHGLPYRPGDELTATRFLAQPTVNIDSPSMRALLAADSGFVRDSFWPDGMVRVSGREYNGLIESPCFKEATDEARTLSCFSCHSMHQDAADDRPLAAWADDQLTAGMNGDRACTQCHAPIQANLAAHTKHAPESSGSRCYNCHMPYTTYGLLKTMRSHTVSSPSAAETVAAGRPNACNLCHLDKTLAWTGETLSRWYGAPPVAMSVEQQTVSAALLWLLRGDAGQRAIAAAAMGWPPAQAASGVEWMPPFLADSLNDSYDAVRYIAGRSLNSLPAFAALPYDFVAPPGRRREAQRQTMAIWDRSRHTPTRVDAALLMTPVGRLDVPAVLEHIRARDNRRILLRE